MGLSASKCSQCHKKKQNLTATGVHVCVCVWGGGSRVLAGEFMFVRYYSMQGCWRTCV